MTEALVASHIALWVLVLVLGALVVALARQVGVLHERVAPAGALTGREHPRPGEAAPVLEVEDWQGRPQRLGGADAQGRSTLLLFVSPTCPVCEVLLPVAKRVRDAERGRMRLVVASDGPRAEHEPLVRRHGLDRETYVLSEALGLAWQVGRVPHAVLLDAAGVVRARGLVNTREHLESLLEARDRDVASVQEFAARSAPPPDAPSPGGRLASRGARRVA